MKEDFIYETLKSTITKPTSLETIIDIFKENKEIGLSVLTEGLDSLEKQGKIIKTRHDRYGITELMNLYIGRVKKNKKGFGFLVNDNIDIEDLYIPIDNLNSAQNGDRVIVRIIRPANTRKDGTKNKSECEVIRILERQNTTFIGTYKEKKSYASVTPDNMTFDQDIIVVENPLTQCQNGDKVIIEITSWGNRHESPEGKIIKYIGHGQDVGVDILSLVYRYNLSPHFTEEQIHEAERLCSLSMEDDIYRRRDFRLYRMITIDGADSKDLDDAVSLEILSNGHYLLGVHIADVGEYIRENSILDQEAFKRGTSVYFVDRVLPMLPPSISNGICSLNAGEDRLTLSCLMEINQNGQIVTTEITEAVINVSERFTYDQVNQILESQSFRDASYVEMFNEMNDLRALLYQKRKERGALEFNLLESKVILDDKGKVTEIQLRERGNAEKIIEEFMIIANETVAAHFFRRKAPFIYRVHDEPDKEKLALLMKYLPKLGIRLPQDKDTLSARDFQNILHQAEQKNCSQIVDMMLLRMMNHAYYTTDKTTHFGLASKYYTHFTSPIRRYSDLSIHRLIKEYLQHDGMITERRNIHYKTILTNASEQASQCERNAEEAERASVDLKKAEYMAAFVDQIFIGKIVNVTGFGFFVRLDNSVEGLVHISSLFDDFYTYDEENIRLIGEHTGNVYQLGQDIKVKLINVSVEESKIDFLVIGSKDANKNKSNKIKKSFKEENSRKKVVAKKKKQKNLSEKTASQGRNKFNSSGKGSKKRGTKSYSRKSKSKA